LVVARASGDLWKVELRRIEREEQKGSIMHNGLRGFRLFAELMVSSSIWFDFDAPRCRRVRVPVTAGAGEPILQILARRRQATGWHAAGVKERMSGGEAM